MPGDDDPFADLVPVATEPQPHDEDPFADLAQQAGGAARGRRGVGQDVKPRALTRGEKIRGAISGYANVPKAALESGGSHVIGAAVNLMGMSGILDEDQVESYRANSAAEAEKRAERLSLAPGAETAAGLVGDVPVWLLPGGVALGSAEMGLNKYGDARAEGATPGEALAAGAVTGLTAAATPAVGRVFAPAGKAVAGRVGEAVAGGAAGGAALGAGEVAATSIYDPEQARERISEIPSQAMLLGALGGVHGALKPGEAPADPFEDLAAHADAVQGHNESIWSQKAEPPVDVQHGAPVVEAPVVRDPRAGAGPAPREIAADPAAEPEIARAQEEQRQAMLEQHRGDEEAALQRAVVSEGAQAEAARVPAPPEPQPAYDPELDAINRDVHRTQREASSQRLAEEEGAALRNRVTHEDMQEGLRQQVRPLEQERARAERAVEAARLTETARAKGMRGSFAHDEATDQFEYRPDVTAAPEAVSPEHIQRLSQAIEDLHHTIRAGKQPEELSHVIQDRRPSPEEGHVQGRGGEARGADIEREPVAGPQDGAGLPHEARPADRGGVERVARGAADRGADRTAREGRGAEPRYQGDRGTGAGDLAREDGSREVHPAEEGAREAASAHESRQEAGGRGEGHPDPALKSLDSSLWQAPPRAAAAATGRSSAAGGEGHDTPQHLAGSHLNRIPVAPLPGGLGKKTAQILLDVGKALGKRVWQGKTAPGAGGTYFPGSAKTLIRYHEDLDTAAHELAHALDDRFGIVGRWAHDPTSPFDAELAPFVASPASSAAAAGPRSSPAYRRAEGVAEWTRAHLVNPDAAEQAAPQFAAYFKSHVPKEAQAALRGFSDDIRRFAGMSATDQAIAHQSDAGDRGPGIISKVKEALSRDGYAFRTTALDRVKARLVDVLAPVMRAVDVAEDIRGRDQKLLPAQDPRVLMRLLGGINDKTQDIFDHGMIDAKFIESDGNGGVKVKRAEGVGGGIDWLTAPAKEAKDLDRLGAYMVAERVLEKAGQIDSDLSKGMNALRTRVGLMRAQEMEGVDRQAKRMRRRAEVRAGRADQAIERSRKAQDLADEQGGKTDADLGEAADEVFRRQEERLGRMLNRLRLQAHGAEADKVEARIAKLRERVDKRRRKLDQDMTGAIDAHEGAKDFATNDTEKQIDQLRAVVERRYLTRIGRIDRRHLRQLRMAEHQKGRLSGAGGGIFKDNERAAKVLDEVRAQPELHERMKEMAKRYRAWADSVLRYQVAHGRLSSEAYEAIKSRNEYYVAMHREENAELGQMFGGKGGKSVGSAAQINQKFKGSTKAIKNPIENLLEQTAKSVQETDRNAAMRAFADLLTTDRGMYEGRPQDLAAIGHQVPEATQGAVTVYRNGEPEHWRFEEGVFQSLKGWGEVAPNDFMHRLAQLPGKLVHAGVTKHPGFIIRNMIRDTVDRSILSENGSKPWDVVRGSSAEMKQAQAATGGSLAGHYLRDRASYKAAMRKRIRELEGANVIVASADRMAHAYQAAAEGSEQRGREAEFRRSFARAKADGMDDLNATLKASMDARGLLDFAVGGTMVKNFNRYVPFVNARVQGVARMVKGLREDPAGIMARWALYAVMPSLATYAYNVATGNEDEYLDLDEHRRDAFWNFKVSKNTWLSVPKPFEFGTLASGVEHTINAIRKGGLAKGEAKAYAAELASSFAPLGVSELAGPLRPLIEAAANYDLGRERAIVPQYEKDKPVDQRAGTVHASRIGQWAQAATGVDGRIVDHVLQGMLGSTGTTLEKLSDIGRADKTGQGAATLMHAAGMFARSPGPEAASVERFRKEESESGRGEGKPSRRLAEKEKEYFQAPDAGAKDEAAGKIRAYATGKDPLRDFDRRAAEASHATSELAKLKAVAKAGGQSDLQAFRAYKAAHQEILGQAKEIEKASALMQKIDRARAAAPAGSARAAELERRMQDLARKFAPAKP